MCVTPPAGVDKYRDHGKLIRDVVAHCLKQVFTGPVAGRIPLLRTSGEEDRERESMLVGLRVAVDVDYGGGMLVK